MAEHPQDDAPTVPDYGRSRYDDAARSRRETTRAIVGGLVTAASVIGLVPLLLICVFAHEDEGFAAALPIPLAATAIVVAIVGGVARHHWTTDRSRSFLLGALIGVAVGLLIEGACFMALK